MQYGKLIGYWNCKITNTSDISAVQCDCEKILTDANGDDDDTLLARGQTSEKIEEWFNPYTSIIPEKDRQIAGRPLSHIFSSPLIGVKSCVFQPPRIS